MTCVAVTEASGHPRRFGSDMTSASRVASFERERTSAERLHPKTAYSRRRLGADRDDRPLRCDMRNLAVVAAQSFVEQAVESHPLTC